MREGERKEERRLTTHGCTSSLFSDPSELRAISSLSWLPLDVGADHQFAVFIMIWIPEASRKMVRCLFPRRAATASVERRVN